MTDYSNIQNTLDREVETFNVELVSLGGVQNVEVTEGTTVKDLKTKLGLSSTTKITNDEGDQLFDNDVIDEEVTLYTSVPKKNGIAA